MSLGPKRSFLLRNLIVICVPLKAKILDDRATFSCRAEWDCEIGTIVESVPSKICLIVILHTVLKKCVCYQLFSKRFDIIPLQTLAWKRSTECYELIHAQLKAAVHNALPVVSKVGEHQGPNPIAIFFRPHMFVDGFLHFATQAKLVRARVVENEILVWMNERVRERMKSHYVWKVSVDD